MIAIAMEGKKSKASPLELPSGVPTRGPSNGSKGDVDAFNRTLKTNFNSVENAQESTGRVSHHVRSFSYDRNKVPNLPAEITKEGLKGGGGTEAMAQGLINQNGGLYVGGGKMVGSNGSPQGAISTSMVSKMDKLESSLQAVHVRSNSAGSIKAGKSLANPPWASGQCSAFEMGSYAVGRKGENAAGSLSSSSSGGGSPAQDPGKGHNENGSGVNKVRGLGNIGGRAGAATAKSPPSGQATGRGSMSTPRNSGEFSIPTNGNVAVGNRGNTTPGHSGEFNGCGTGPGSSSSNSSPHTSGELGGSKANLSSFSKSSPDSSNGNPTSGGGGQSRSAHVDGNIPGGRVNLGLNAGRGTKPNASGSPPRVSSATTTQSMGNLRKANWISGHTKSNEKLDCVMGNILNPNHMLPVANGNILSSGYTNNGKGSGKGDAMKGGVAITNADSLNDTVLLKKGFSSCNAEEVNFFGNELYRRRNFSDALSLYQRAISLSPLQASYRSNKAAALSGLGRLPEAVHECEEAIKLDSLYVRAHQRAASLYLRLGLLESSNHHFQSAMQQSSVQELQQVEKVKVHISKCIEMRKVSNWMAVLKESDAAVVVGADSAPQVMGYKAEALFKLRRFDEADAVLLAAQRLEEALTKLGITPADSFLYVIRANLDMSLGRFEEAVAAAQSAVRVDPRNAEALATLKKARAVCLARSSGNELFKMGKFFEACAVYGEGLESDPLNAVLLCNRAACRSKIGQWEKAVEDCTAALEVQPNYTKALLRRADCNAKLERWEDALNDYDNLMKELPGDREVVRGVFEAQSALKRLRGEMCKKMSRIDMEEVSDKEQFREVVTFPGLVVVQFLARWNDRCQEILPFIEGLCKRYPSVNFVKVDIEESPYLAKMESVNSVPTFKLYKNGTIMKEMMGPSQQALEHAVQQFSL